MDKRKAAAILFAVLAALFYAANIPFSKMLLKEIEPTFLASFLYLGAGVGIGILYLFGNIRKRKEEEKLTAKDLPYTIGMIVLDIAAPILLMAGLKSATSSNAALLGNFEIVATSILAMLVFREKISVRLWAAISLITAASILLSFEDLTAFRFSGGALFILGATVCWGLENNCTRKISSKNTYQIVTLKGIFSGMGSFFVALIQGEHLPEARFILYAMLLGFLAYGFSIFLYIRAQKELGAAKTSAYYAVAPFAGAFLSFLILKEPIRSPYILALAVMLAGSVLVVVDTMIRNHAHLHTHTFVHIHDGKIHVHTIEHMHDHNHLVNDHTHMHHH